MLNGRGRVGVRLRTASVGGSIHGPRLCARPRCVPGTAGDVTSSFRAGGEPERAEAFHRNPSVRPTLDPSADRQIGFRCCCAGEVPQPTGHACSPNSMPDPATGSPTPGSTGFCASATAPASRPAADDPPPPARSTTPTTTPTAAPPTRANTTPLCPSHHHRKTVGAWKLRQTRPGRLRMDQPPGPHLPHPSRTTQPTTGITRVTAAYPPGQRPRPAAVPTVPYRWRSHPACRPPARAQPRCVVSRCRSGEQVVDGAVDALLRDGVAGPQVLGEEAHPQLLDHPADLGHRRRHGG